MRISKKTGNETDLEVATTSKLEVVTKHLNSIKCVELDFPSYQEVFNDQNLSEIVDSILEIINDYSDGDLKSVDILDSDLVRVSSYLVTLSMHVGALQGYANHADQNLKFVEAQQYNQSAQYVDRQDIKVTNTDLSNLVKANSRELRENALSYSTALSVITNFMFSVKQFIEVLSSITKRASYNP